MTGKRTVTDIIKQLDLDTVEYDYIIKSLQQAVSYCYEQYHDSCGDIDPIDSAEHIGLSNKDDKYKLLEDYLQTLSFN